MAFRYNQADMAKDGRKWNLGISRLSAIMTNPASSVDEDHVGEFHEIVTLIEEGSGEDLSTFRIPVEKLQPKPLSFTRAAYGSGQPGSFIYSEKKYCDTRYFRSQLRGLANYVMILQAKSGGPVNPYELLSDDQLKQELSERRIKPKRPNGTYGYDRASALEQLLEYERSKSAPAGSPSTVINFHGVQHSNLNLNSPGASITQTVSYQSDDFRRLLTELKGFSDAHDLPQPQRDLIKVDIGTIEVQLGSPQPKSSIVRECLLSAKAILENAAGTVAASALASQILPHLLHYLS